MKKILLAVCALFVFGAVFAQNGRVDVRKNAVAVPYVKKAQLTGFEEGAEPQVQPSMMRSLSRNFIGTTFYDCQTNGSMSQRIIAHNDGSISAIWTTNGATASTRGTGYNYFTGEDWVNPASSTDRIENVRTGWGTITCIGDAEIVASHNGSNALVIGICPQKGTQDWTFTTLQGPAATGASGTSTCLLWPMLASSGNYVHLLACTESDAGYLYQGIQTCLLYYRGLFDPATKTISWENPRIVGNVTPSEVSQFSGDSYAITAKGNNVAIVAMPSSTMDAFLWKSTDNGANFTKTIFLESAIKNGNLSAMLDTNLYVQDGICAVALGDDGMAHIAFGAYLVSSDVDTGDSWCFNHPVFSQPKNISPGSSSFFGVSCRPSPHAFVPRDVSFLKLSVLLRPNRFKIQFHIPFFLYFCSGDSDVIRATRMRRNRRFQSHLKRSDDVLS